MKFLERKLDGLEQKLREFSRLDLDQEKRKEVEMMLDECLKDVQVCSQLKSEVAEILKNNSTKVLGSSQSDKELERILEDLEEVSQRVFLRNERSHKLK